MDIIFIKWKNIIFCEALWRKFLLWKLILDFVQVIWKSKNCTFLDTFIISNIVTFTLFQGLYCDFYNGQRFLPYLHFAQANNGLLPKNSWNLKKYKKEGLMFWNISPKQYQLKCFNNSLCTKHLHAAISMMICAFFKTWKEIEEILFIYISYIRGCSYEKNYPS